MTLRFGEPGDNGGADEVNFDESLSDEEVVVVVLADDGGAFLDDSTDCAAGLRDEDVAWLDDEWRSDGDLLSDSDFFLREMIFFSVTTIGVYLAGGSSDLRSCEKGWSIYYLLLSAMISLQFS